MHFKNEKELAKVGLAIDPTDPTKAVRLDARADSLASHADNASPAEGGSPQTTDSFTRETSPGPLEDLDDQALLAGMRDECAAIRALDARYPTRYHRLGTFLTEVRKRIGNEEVRHFLRQEDIDNTTAWRAEQIAKLYTCDQAAAFSSLRAILRTLPAKQPRKPKTPTVRTNDGGQQLPTPEEPPQVFPEPRVLVDEFVRLGIRIKELLGDEAIDRAVEQIKAHVPETFEAAFAEV